LVLAAHDIDIVKAFCVAADAFQLMKVGLACFHFDEEDWASYLWNCCHATVTGLEIFP